MSDSVIVTAADQNYLPHAKAFFVNCVRQGGWRGDFALILQDQADASSIECRGIDILRVPEKACSLKFRMFSPYFLKWQRLMFFDCDSLVQGDLNRLCDAVAEKFPAIPCDGSQDTTILQDWECFDPDKGGHPEAYERLKARFPCVTERLFGSSAMAFAPDSIPPGTVERILAVQEEFRDINPGGYDQQVIGLVLHDQLLRMTKDYWVWFAFDYPENRVASESRGWRGDEEPAVLHYWHTMAPWVVKQDGTGGYFNHRLGRICHELYAENLAAFEETFPCRTK